MDRRAEIDFHLSIAKRLATLLDDKFEVWGIKFGLDPLLDLIPGWGDVLAGLIGFYIINVARELKMPLELITKMFINLILDFVIGLVPILGSIGTVFFRSNRLNMKIIEDYLRSDGGMVEEGQVLG